MTLLNDKATTRDGVASKTWSLPAAGPGAVGEAVVEVVSGDPAVDWSLHELVHHGGDGGVQHEGDQEQESKERDNRNSPCFDRIDNKFTCLIMKENPQYSMYVFFGRDLYEKHEFFFCYSRPRIYHYND